MLTSNHLQNLRAGPVMRAGGVKDGTVRAWRMNNNLTVGREPMGGGYPRYDLADAARLTMMRYLMERLQMPAQAAATTTNAAHSIFALLAMHEFQAIDCPEGAARPERYVMVLDRVDETFAPEIYPEDRLAARGSRILEVRVQLNELVELARDNLVAAIGESPLDLRRRLRGESAPEAVEA